MKFLCLHGIGTNNQIFKMQTAAFRYELGDQHTYEFVQGAVPWDLASELEHLSSASSHHYAYYDLTSEASFISALDNLESYIETEGPFDGVMAFSQGAGLVAMLLVRRQYLRPEDPALFRCAILFSPVHVYDPVAYLERGEVQVLESMAPGIKLTPIPMVIVYGNEDDRKKECQDALAICDPDLLSVFVHDGGHEIPGLGAKNGLSDTVKIARRGITRAELTSQG
ncbi:serine hydrolase FSH [Xylaria arbuscula]|nr:serine hydrolase FSH [Xylaria arbuscula]